MTGLKPAGLLISWTFWNVSGRNGAPPEILPVRRSMLRVARGLFAESKLSGKLVKNARRTER